jgi:catechol 2,3-dioxygenase-like lactoylglutathione lyase family enzyme
MKVTRLCSVAVAGPDTDALVGFYAGAWGLTDVATKGDTAYLRGGGREHHILTVAPGDRARLVGYRLGLDDAAAVDAAAAELRQHRGVVVIAAPDSLDTPGGGYGMTITDPDGRLIELVADVAAHDDGAGASGSPHKISHIVVNSPDASAYECFLVDVLGFALADEMPHMSFYRCNADHHSVAVTKAPHASLNHVAFEVASVGDVLDGLERLRGSTPMIWGPNRHGPGNNVFAYFTAPNGQVVEYTAEVEQIDVEHPPRPKMWRPEDGRVVDAWATQETLRPTPDARAVMLGQPEPALAAPSSVGGAGAAHQ